MFTLSPSLYLYHIGSSRKLDASGSEEYFLCWNFISLSFFFFTNFFRSTTQKKDPVHFKSTSLERLSVSLQDHYRSRQLKRRWKQSILGASLLLFPMRRGAMIGRTWSHRGIWLLEGRLRGVRAMESWQGQFESSIPWDSYFVTLQSNAM